MIYVYTILALFGIGTIGLSIRSLISWFKNGEAARQKFEQMTAEARHRAEVARTAGDILREKARSEANKTLEALPLDPSDEEADRLLREAESRLRR